MKTSESLSSFAPAFAAAQATMQNASKSAKNPFFNSTYATLEIVLAAVMPALNANGISMLQGIGPSGEVTTRLLHSSGEWIESTVSCPDEPKAADAKPGKINPLQVLGSKITYLRRYGAAAICSITQTDDDGNEAGGPVAKSRAPEEEPVLSLAQALDAITEGNVESEVLAKISPTVAYLQASDDTVKFTELTTAFRRKFPRKDAPKPKREIAQ